MNLANSFQKARNTSSDGSIVTGSSFQPYYVKELYKNVEKYESTAVFASTNLPKSEINLNMVKAASATYHLSPNIEDYIMIPLPIVTGNIPNRNKQAFHFLELSYFDPTAGCMIFETFKGKCCHLNHKDNTNPVVSKGIIVDAFMEHIPKYDIWKVSAVTLWDRTKDPTLCEKLMSKKLNTFSMGSMVNAFVCSVCGKIKQEEVCEHAQASKLGKVYGDRISFSWLVDSCFFEISAVEDDPADHTAESQLVYL